MKKLLKKPLFLFFCMLFLSSFAFADVPKTFAFQGRITDNAGVPITDNNASFRFGFFTAAGSQVGVFEEMTSRVDAGIYSVNIPVRDAVLAALNQPLFIQVEFKAQSDSGYTPFGRTQLTASPYAMSVRNYSIAGINIATAAVTLDKLSVSGTATTSSFLTKSGNDLAWGTVSGVLPSGNLANNYLGTNASNTVMWLAPVTSATSGSQSLITSGGVFSALVNKQNLIAAGTANDIVAYSTTAGTLNTLSRVIAIAVVAGSRSDTNIPTEKAVGAYVDTAVSGAVSGKQNTIPAGNANDIVAYTTTAGSVGILNRITTISATAGSRLDTRIPTERAVGAYVDSAVGGKQNTIPSGNANDIVAYTTTAGSVGILNRVTTISAMAGSRLDTRIPTERAVGTYVDSAVGGKQNTIPSGNANDIVAYTTTAGTVGTLTRAQSIGSSNLSSQTQLPTVKAVVDYTASLTGGMPTGGSAGQYIRASNTSNSQWVSFGPGLTDNASGVSVTHPLPVAFPALTGNSGKALTATNDTTLGWIDVVDLTSPQTITGAKTFQSNVLISAGNTLTVGGTTLEYSSIGGSIGANGLIINTNTNVKGDFNVTGTTYNENADLAEIYPSTDILEPGDVVIISETRDDHIEKSKIANDTKVAGVISTEPGIVLNSKEKGYKLALVGKVPVNVTNEGGNIKRGDLLVASSTPGYAMKATDPKPGTIIGKALENLTGSRGKILALVNLQ